MKKIKSKIDNIAYLIFEISVAILIFGGMLAISVAVGTYTSIILWNWNKYIFGLYIIFIIGLVVVGIYSIFDEIRNKTRDNKK